VPGESPETVGWLAAVVYPFPAVVYPFPASLSSLLESLSLLPAVVSSFAAARSALAAVRGSFAAGLSSVAAGMHRLFAVLSQFPAYRCQVQDVLRKEQAVRHGLAGDVSSNGAVRCLFPEARQELSESRAVHRADGGMEFLASRLASSTS
jgi:hypothetical protein